MNIEASAIAGLFVVRPQKFEDSRGYLFESLRVRELECAVGAPFAVVQVNYSVSRRNTLRGMHSVTNPPGQAKYVTCVRGAARDVVADVRPGSPTYARYEQRTLTAEEGQAIYIADGLSHGFLALTDDTCLCYLLSEVYVPGTQVNINAFDDELDIDWGLEDVALMSGQDRTAVSLAEARRLALLTEWVPT